MKTLLREIFNSFRVAVRQQDARRAHEMLEAREVIGKVLLKP